MIREQMSGVHEFNFRQKSSPRGGLPSPTWSISSGDGLLQQQRQDVFGAFADHERRLDFTRGIRIDLDHDLISEKDHGRPDRDWTDLG